MILYDTTVNIFSFRRMYLQEYPENLTIIKTYVTDRKTKKEHTYLTTEVKAVYIYLFSLYLRRKRQSN